jgi:mannose/cellobiose epimerase-like protein (N-acyl-D-glucosamine 2-epimerase family)
MVTSPSAESNIARARKWLSDDMFPLWKTRGVSRDGGFIEALTLKGEPLDIPRRAMVQARQIYSFRTGRDMGCLPASEADPIIVRAGAFLVDRFSLPSGGFVHSKGEGGKAGSDRVDLYTQAFALFGLANVYAVSKDSRFKTRAVALVDYLRRERRGRVAGYTELEDGREVLRSNPHMHLFEAALAWMEADTDPLWRALADEILDTCLARFIDPASGALCEIFQDDGAPQRTGGRFFFEPGHHYEWTWLMTLHQELTGRDSGAARAGLFATAERWGVTPVGNAMDEVWSDGAPKKTSSRFWPQGERIKAAVRTGAFASSDQAFHALFRYLEAPAPGLWRDTLLEDGKFREEPVKASSLYHIINAFAEYAAHRPAGSDAAGPKTRPR